MNQIKIPMQKEKFCNHCGKKYAKPANYEKHHLLCDIIHKTEKEREKEVQAQNMIKNQTELIKVIQHLVVKCNQLETKMETMMHWVNKEKKKINVIDWLQSQSKESLYYPDSVFDELSKHTTGNCNEKHVEIIKQHSLLDGLRSILEDSFQNRKIPLCCFSLKQDTLYVCESLVPVIWKELDKKTIIAFFNGIQKKLLFLLGEWKKNNRQLFENDDHACELYNKTMMKMLISFCEDANYSKVKRMLTNMTKIDVKNILEYELEN
jgi:hypothetical protein